MLTYCAGEGSYDPDVAIDDDETPFAVECNEPLLDFAPPRKHVSATPRARKSLLPELPEQDEPQSAIGRLHNAWSTAVNSRLGRADNERFMEHFRYIIVASQLLNEYLDHGSLQPTATLAGSLDGAEDHSALSSVQTSLYGAAATAVAAFALVYVIHWARSSRSGFLSKSRLAIALAVFAVLAIVGYAYVRRQWLKFLRRNAVSTASTLTGNWQAFEVSSSSALSFIQEVELVSKGYRLTTPLPPASRIEDKGTSRRCGRLRKALHKAYANVIPACIEACNTLRTLVDEDDLEKYYEVYDVSEEDAKEALGDDSLSVLEDDPESLKSLRLLSYRAGILRRVLLCSMMSLEADGGKPDFNRWRIAIEVMEAISKLVGMSAEKLRQMVNDMETIQMPHSPVTPVRSGHGAGREKMRSQVRKISMLSSGIRGLQAKMQILREETNKSIEQSEDLTDLGPSLMAQYESIGTDLKELMQAWETGKASLQTNITKQEHRISMASTATSGLRSPVSSLGGLTAVEEGGSPADALNALNGGFLSKRSSTATSPSDEERVFEAVAMPRQRSSLTREERIIKMQEERERQATLRAKRESNTHMLRELESVINLRPRSKTNGMGRITSI